MNQRTIEELRKRVDWSMLLEQQSWRLDRKESTRRALKYRRDDVEVVIVIHPGASWFTRIGAIEGGRN